MKRPDLERLAADAWEASRPSDWSCTTTGIWSELAVAERELMIAFARELAARIESRHARQLRDLEAQIAAFLEEVAA